MSQQPLSDSGQTSSIETPVAPSLTSVMGVAPVLPGEPADFYQKSLNALIKELGARSVLQVYLAEKIHECLWWMRRYEEQKRKTVIVQMAYLTDQTSAYRIGDSTIQMQVRSALLANMVDNATLKAAKNKDHTIESLRQKAMEDKQAELLQLDQQIALQSKILTGLQLSYEVAFNRKTNVERLQLQNALLHRDLQGIEVLAIDNSKDDQR